MSEPTKEQIDLCNKAMARFGVNMQLMIAMEECAELAVAVSHFLRGREGGAEALAEEIADVELVCVSLRELVGGAWDVDAIKERKWRRLEERLKKSGAK